jgi:hypothetical protein
MDTGTGSVACVGFFYLSFNLLFSGVTVKVEGDRKRKLSEVSVASDAANTSQTEVKKEKKKKKKDKKEKEGEGADTTANSAMDSTMDVSCKLHTVSVRYGHAVVSFWIQLFDQLLS